MHKKDKNDDKNKKKLERPSTPKTNRVLKKNIL
jgi:hypothetical protein